MPLNSNIQRDPFLYNAARQVSMNQHNTILTLVTDQSTLSLEPGIVHAVLARAELYGETIWLAENKAADIDLANEKRSINELKARVSDAIADLKIDFCIQPTINRRKKLLISDMDSTIIQEECIDEIADMAGIKPEVAQITEQAMRGEIEFEDALRERVNLLKGLDAGALRKVIDERIHLTPGARSLVQTMAANGATCALVSGGFTFFTDHIAKLTGFHHTSANNLLIENDHLTGEVQNPILGSDSKMKALFTLSEEAGIELKDTLAVGDGANDLAMIKKAGLGVAYKAKPIVTEQAGAAINHTDLLSILYMQGYTKSEIKE